MQKWEIKMPRSGWVMEGPPVPWQCLSIPDAWPVGLQVQSSEAAVF